MRNPCRLDIYNADVADFQRPGFWHSWKIRISLLMSLATRLTALMTDKAISIRIHLGLDSLSSRWQQLEVCTATSLHQSYDWCREWLAAHGTTPLVIEAVIDGRTELILPLEMKWMGPVRVARFIGAAFSNLNTGLFELGFSGHRPDLIGAIRTAASPHTDVLVLENMPLAWRGVENPLANLPMTPNTNSSFQLELDRSFEATLAKLNASKRMKKFRASNRRFLEAGGYEHVVATGADVAGDMLDLFFKQKSARFENQHLPDVFSDPMTRAFFLRLAQLPQQGPNYALQLHALCLKGDHDRKTVAIAGLSRKGDHVICQFGSIDDSIIPNASPGDFLFHLIIEQLCKDDIGVFDFGVGDQTYKRAWCNIETNQYDFMLPITARGEAYARAHRLKTHAKRYIKSRPALYGLIQRVRAKLPFR